MPNSIFHVALHFKLGPKLIHQCRCRSLQETWQFKRTSTSHRCQTKNPTEKNTYLQITNCHLVLCQFYRRKQEPLPWIWLLDTVSLDRCTPIKSVHLSRKIGPNHTPFRKQRCLNRDCHDCHGVFMCIFQYVSYHLVISYLSFVKSIGT